MTHEYPPIVGDWYKNGDGRSFEIVASDESEETIEIQYYDGDVEEIDFETWHDLEIELIEPPEDWSGPFDDLEKDDLGYSDLTPPAKGQPNPLDQID